MPRVDVIVVAFNSADTLRGCVEPLAEWNDAEVIVVDNASTDGSLDSVKDLPVKRIASSSNSGFASGCNRGARAGAAPSLLFLNPDARISPSSVDRLLACLDDDPRVGAVGPKILRPDGSLEYSQRRFPRLASTYARALYMHRIFPAAGWVDELVRDSRSYERTVSAEWMSGACLMVRRRLFEDLGGFDEGFFMYAEDKDLCRRIWSRGYDVSFEPTATCLHEGGKSAPRASLLPVLAQSRIRYARKHSGPGATFLEAAGLILGAMTHAGLARGGWSVRAGHLRSALSIGISLRSVLLARPVGHRSANETVPGNPNR